MTTTLLSLLIGALLGLALCAIAAIFVPSTPDIGDTIRRLYSPEAAVRLRVQASKAPQEMSRTERFGTWVQQHVRVFPSSVSYRDMEALEMIPAQLYATKALLALMGASMSVLIGFIQALMGAPAVTLPGVLGVVLAVVGWVVPDILTKANAQTKREAFVRTVTAYYDLVTLMRLSGAAVTDAITVPAQIADAPLFVRIRGTLTRQQLEHKAPWDGLLELADDIDLPELRDLGDLMVLSGTRGTPASATLRAKARDIRSERLNLDMEAAQRQLQRSVAAQVLLLVCIIGFVATPAFIRLISY